MVYSRIYTSTLQQLFCSMTFANKTTHAVAEGSPRLTQPRQVADYDDDFDWGSYNTPRRIIACNRAASRCGNYCEIRMAGQIKLGCRPQSNLLGNYTC